MCLRFRLSSRLRHNALLDDAALDTLFRAARTHYAWTEQPVGDHELHRIHDLLRMGPTSANCSRRASCSSAPRRLKNGCARRCPPATWTRPCRRRSSRSLRTTRRSTSPFPNCSLTPTPAPGLPATRRCPMQPPAVQLPGATEPGDSERLEFGLSVHITPPCCRGCRLDAKAECRPSARRSGC